MDIQLLIIACVVLAFVISLAVEIEKKIFSKFPVNALTFITSVVVTVIAFIGYIFATGTAVTVVAVIGCIGLCIAETYIAMFGYDKFIQTIKQYEEYLKEMQKLQDKED